MIENEIIYGRKKNFYLCIVRKSMDFMDCYGNVIMIWDYVWDIGGCYMVYYWIIIMDMIMWIYLEGK